MEFQKPHPHESNGLTLSRVQALFDAAKEPAPEDRPPGEPTSPLLQQYLKIAGTGPSLDAQEERALFLALKEESPKAIEAKRKLVAAYLWLVISAAEEFKTAELSEEDLVASGNFALSYAVSKFDADQGVRFSTYAYRAIVNAMSETISNSARPIRIPKKKLLDAKLVRELLSEAMEKEERALTIEELSEATGFSIAYLSSLLQLPYSVLSLDQSSDEGDAEGMVNALESEAEEAGDRLTFNDQEVLTEVLLSALDDREKEIVAWRSGLSGNKPLSFVEIGNRLSISAERARQLYVRAQVKMEKAAKEDANG